MPTLYNLATTLIEAAANNEYGSNLPVLEPMRFYGTVAEAAFEANDFIMSESVDLFEFAVGTEEVMVESAFASNTEVASAINEAASKSMWAGIKNWFGRIIEAVKGMWEKVKAFFAQMTNNTDTWVKIMRPKIEANAGNSKAQALKFNMHKWNVEYIMSGISKAMTDLTNDLMQSNAREAMETANRAIGEALSKGIGAYRSEDNQTSKNLDDMRSASKAATHDDETVREMGSEHLKDIIDNLDKQRKELEEEVNKYKEEYTTNLVSTFGLSGAAASISDVKALVNEKAKGKTKLTISFSELDSSKMLNTIETSKSSRKALESNYKNIVRYLETLRKLAESGASNTERQMNQGLDSKLQTVISQYLTTFSKFNSLKLGNIVTAVNTACSLNTSLIKEMVGEYMNVLTKVAGDKNKHIDPNLDTGDDDDRREM